MSINSSNGHVSSVYCIIYHHFYTNHRLKLYACFSVSVIDVAYTILDQISIFVCLGKFFIQLHCQDSACFVSIVNCVSHHSSFYLAPSNQSASLIYEGLLFCFKLWGFSSFYICKIDMIVMLLYIVLFIHSFECLL